MGKYDKEWKRKTTPATKPPMRQKTLPVKPSGFGREVVKPVVADARLRVAALIMEEIEGCEMQPSDPMAVALRQIATEMRAGFYNAPVDPGIKPPWE